MARLLASRPVLAVHDLDRSAEWYSRVLGCEVHRIDGWAFCTSGDVTFMVGHCPDASPAAEIGDHSYVAYLRVDGIEEIHDTARVAGADIIKAPKDEPWGMREMAIRSPDGHRFMLGEPI